MPDRPRLTPEDADALVEVCRRQRDAALKELSGLKSLPAILAQRVGPIRQRWADEAQHALAVAKRLRDEVGG